MRTRYSDEFMVRAVAMIDACGSVTDVSRQLGVARSILYRWQDAWTESFMGTLKTEMRGEEPFGDLHNARRSLFDYIDAFYNSRRLHSSIGYLSPNQFETKFHQSK